MKKIRDQQCFSWEGTELHWWFLCESMEINYLSPCKVIGHIMLLVSHVPLHKVNHGQCMTKNKSIHMGMGTRANHLYPPPRGLCLTLYPITSWLKACMWTWISPYISTGVGIAFCHFPFTGIVHHHISIPSKGAGMLFCIQYDEWWSDHHQGSFS